MLLNCHDSEFQYFEPFGHMLIVTAKDFLDISPWDPMDTERPLT